MVSGKFLVIGLLVWMFLISFTLADQFLSYGDSQVVLYGGMSCAKDASSARWVNWTGGNSIFVYNATIGNVPGGNCSRYTFEESAGVCCPTGFICTLSTGKCAAASTVITGCSQYTDKASCELYDPQIAVASIESINGTTGICNLETSYGLCLNQSTCSCTWNSTRKTCSSTKEVISMCYGSNQINHSTCNWVQTNLETLCDTEGKIKVTYSASGNALGYQSWCANTVKEYPCSASLKLPFFSWFNVILSALTLGFVYLIISKKSKI